MTTTSRVALLFSIALAVGAAAPGAADAGMPGARAVRRAVARYKHARWNRQLTRAVDAQIDAHEPLRTFFDARLAHHLGDVDAMMSSGLALSPMFGDGMGVYLYGRYRDALKRARVDTVKQSENNGPPLFFDGRQVYGYGFTDWPTTKNIGIGTMPIRRRWIADQPQ